MTNTNMTVREAILDVLASAQRPLTQVEIADIGWLHDASVRRECQRLERECLIECVETVGRRPKFMLTSIPIPVSPIEANVSC